nr:hypothetical protein [Tanacetum cinerariifolium]
MHQPWRSFAAIINRCLSGKTTGLDSLCLSRAQIIWGMYHKKNVDYVYLLWEDLVYQVENTNSKKNINMCYPRFTKVIIDYFITSISKTKYKKKADKPDISSKSKTAPASKGSRLKSSEKVAKTAKKKQPATMPKTKGLVVLSKVALSEAKQIKLATKRRKKDFHMSHASGSGDGVDIQSKSDKKSCTFSQDDDDADEGTYVNDDSKETEYDNNEDDLTHPNLSTYTADDEEEEKEKADDDDEVSSNHRMYTPPDHQIIDEKDNQEGDDEVKEDLVSKFINPSSNTGIDSILSPKLQSETLVNVSVSIAAEISSSDTTIPQPPIPNIQPLQQTPESTTKTMKDAVDVAVQLQTNKLKEKAQAKNHEFLNQNVHSTHCHSRTCGRSTIRSRKLPEEDQSQKARHIRSDLRRMTPYTAYPDIQGIINKDEMNRNYLMRTNELYMFSDGTLNHVHTALNDIATVIEMDYFPKQK